MLEAASQQMWMRIHENYVGSTVRTLANKVVVTLPSGGTHHAPAIFGVPRVGDLATIDGESHTVMSVVWDYDGSVIRVTLGPP